MILLDHEDLDISSYSIEDMSMPYLEILLDGDNEMDMNELLKVAFKVMVF